MNQLNRYAYVGTYTKSNAQQPHRTEGVFLYQVDSGNGKWTPVSAYPAGLNPSFLTFSPDRRFLYAVNELRQGEASAFAVNAQNGGLSLLNSQPTHGADPCYVCCDASGRWLLIANYSSGCLSVFPLAEDGRLLPLNDLVQHTGSGPLTDRQEQAHAHSIRFDPSGRFILAADLGIDQVLVYRLNADGHLLLHEPSGLTTQPGAGPRHFDFSPSGKIMYLANELYSTVMACTWDSEKGILQPFQTLATLPAGFEGVNTVADIHVAPGGAWLYVSNRGHDSLAIFAIELSSGKLTPAGYASTGGLWPRNFAIDPSGNYLYVANQNSNSIVAFRINLETGQLSPTGQVIAVPSPVCVIIIDL
jgi:6-phosphogluconolactonase